METIEHLIQHPKKRLHETPLFFQHGAWHGAWCWEQFLSYFTGLGYEVHAISLPGHGNSSTNKGHVNRYRFQDYVECMAAEIAMVSPTPVVVGHSLGGGIVQKVLETHRVPGAVLLASLPVTGMMGTTLRMLWRYPWPTIKTAVLMNGYAWVETPELAKAHLFSAETAVDIHEFHARLVGESSLAGYRLLFAPFRSDRVHSPVLVLAAEKDAVFTLAEERRTAKALHAKFQVFAGQAHNLMMDTAWPQVAAAIDDWVTNELRLP